LRFLLQVGLLPDTGSRLRAYLDSGLALPVLPAPSETRSQAQPVELARGDTIIVRLHMSAVRQISWYRDQWKGDSSLFKTLPGQFGPGDTSFSIVPGGTIHIRTRAQPTDPWSGPIRVDCTKQVLCSVGIP
jgi:hypothetical protein